ncbi:MAG TPA: mechanosensitive ion channel family protein [Spirochaetota bacterium]|jgi:small-conductance mechanosensitive channel|nr:MAG: Low conductance mechanosensitive channel YnaI [Spirochaetes bacterium ADurb.Bin133]HNZ26412.1 mechanosensitive ion channel family protein [Spirochaetota bacterium]HPY87796.1 mechanosensitive ion channel family protein [Spirochaetota bacterium]
MIYSGSIKDFLQKEFFGNSIESYIIFIIILLSIMLILFVIEKIVIAKFQTFSKKTNTNLDDLIVNIVKKNMFPLTSYGSFYLALKYLKINALLSKVVSILGLIIFLVNVVNIISKLLKYYIENGSDKNPERSERINILKGIFPAIEIILWGIGVVFLMDNLGFNISAVVAGLGIGGIAVAMGAQKILGDIFSYLFILIDKPFEIGDYIVLGEYNGNIERIGLKTTRVRSLGGEQLVFSNSDIASSRIRNYKSMRERRVVFSIGVTYDTPVETLKSMPGIIKNLIEKNGGVRFDRAVFSSFGDYSLKFEAVYFVLTGDYKVFAEIQQAINFDILEIFKSKEIKFAFPTNTVYINKK